MLRLDSTHGELDLDRFHHALFLLFQDGAGKEGDGEIPCFGEPEYKPMCNVSGSLRIGMSVRRWRPYRPFGGRFGIIPRLERRD
jgi:hypothetical protein